MAVTTLKLDGREYVILTRTRYEELTSAAQDRLDAAVADKARRAYESGKLKTVSHAQLKRRLGL